MATQEVGNIQDWENWGSISQSGRFAQALSGLWRFARRKPLGAVCGLLIVFFVIIGDLVPETVNKASQIAGFGETPMPYLADALADRLGFVYPYDEPHFDARFEGSSGSHLLGTDNLGRDTFSRLIYGSRIAVVVSFGAVFISAVMQVLISVPAGFYGGWYDKVIYRIVDIADAIPTLVVLIAIFGLFGSGLWAMVFVIGFIFGFGGRYLRGQTLSLMTSPFIEAARTVGASDGRIMIRHIIPNIMPLIIFGATLRLGIIILLEASLSFLGFGVPPPFPSWGQMLSLEGREYMRAHPGLAIYPGLAIGLLVFSFNLFGDALRDVLDPRLRGSR